MKRLGNIALRCLLLGLLVPSFTNCPNVRPLRLVFDQSSHTLSGGFSELAYTDYTASVQQLADDFSLPAGRSRIKVVTWWGAYRNNVPAEDNFVVRLFNDNGAGLPETSAASGSRVTVTRQATDDTIEVSDDTLDVYVYTLELETPLVLEPDTNYFLSVVNDTGRWIWCAVDWDSPQGNNSGAVRNSTDREWSHITLDMSFRLWYR